VIKSFLGSNLLLSSLDDTDGNGLFHVSDGESSERRILSESLTAHWLGGFHGNDGGVTVLNEFGLFFSGLTSSSVNLGLDFILISGTERFLKLNPNLYMAMAHQELLGEFQLT
jgi:hypothetical protein